MKKVFFLAVIPLVLAGCPKNSSNNPIANVKEALADKDLQGKNFVSNCEATPSEGLYTSVFSGTDAAIGSSQVTYRFEGANVHRISRFYHSVDCQGDALMSIQENGDIKINTDQNNKTNDGGKVIDMQFNNAKATIDTDAGAKAANGIKMCGISDWNKAKEVDVTAHAAEAQCANVKMPRKLSNVYRVDAGKLYLGSDATKTDVNTRPSKVMSGPEFTAK